MLCVGLASRDDPLQALGVTSFCLNGLRQAAPSQDYQCFRFEAGCRGWEASYTACSAIFSDCDGKPHRRRRPFGSKFVDRAGGPLAGCVMEHRGVRYELRRALGNDEWVWTVYTPAPKQGYVSGDRYFAMQRAMSVIDRWCGRNAESVPPQASQEASMGRHERLSERG